MLMPRRHHEGRLPPPTHPGHLHFSLLFRTKKNEGQEYRGHSRLVCLRVILENKNASTGSIPNIGTAFEDRHRIGSNCASRVKNHTTGWLKKHPTKNCRCTWSAAAAATARWPFLNLLDVPEEPPSVGGPAVDREASRPRHGDVGPGSARAHVTQRSVRGEITRVHLWPEGARAGGGVDRVFVIP